MRREGGNIDLRKEQGVTLRELLVASARKLDINLTDGQADSCLLYLAELKRWNRKINLTAIREDRDIIIKHFLDSFAFLKGFVPVEGLSLLDMGSGAGFPALPLKIVHPEMGITLVEATRKKAAFLRHIIRILGLSEARVLDKRTEELPDSFEQGFEIVTARAFADMEAALGAGIRFLKPGGFLVLSRGPEESVNEQEMKKAGVAVVGKTLLTLPYSDYQRAIWVFRRAG